jgi:hypothetical protein
MSVSTEGMTAGTRLLPAPPTPRTDYAVSSPFSRGICCLSILAHIHGSIGWRLAFAHAEPHFRRANLLIDAISHLFQLDERGYGFEKRLVCQEGITRWHHQSRQRDTELVGYLGDLCCDRGLGIRDAEGTEIGRLM